MISNTPSNSTEESYCYYFYSPHQITPKMSKTNVVANITTIATITD